MLTPVLPSIPRGSVMAEGAAGILPASACMLGPPALPPSAIECIPLEPEGPMRAPLGSPQPLPLVAFGAAAFPPAGGAPAAFAVGPPPDPPALAGPGSSSLLQPGKNPSAAAAASKPPW